MLEITFGGSPLDPADRLRNNEVWLQNRLADQRSRFLPMWSLQAFLDHSDPSRLKWIGRQDFGADSGVDSGQRTVVFLGLADDVAHFAIDSDDLAPGNETPFQTLGRFVEVRAAAMQLTAGDAGIVARVRSIIDWHKRHGFCARCGAPTFVGRGGYLRECRATGCGAQHFPRVDPVVIMLITRGDKCLLGRQSRFPPGMYSALAGFMEPGETIEEAVRRESFEEAGIRIGAVRYVASQPWPFPSNLMIGCMAEALNDRIVLDEAELEAACWTSKENIERALAGGGSPEFFLPPPLAIAHQLLRYWAAQ